MGRRSVILHFRAAEIEGTFDSEGEFFTPEAAQDYLLRVARVANSVWRSLPDEPAVEPTEADAKPDD